MPRGKAKTGHSVDEVWPRRKDKSAKILPWELRLDARQRLQEEHTHFHAQVARNMQVWNGLVDVALGVPVGKQAAGERAYSTGGYPRLASYFAALAKPEPAPAPATAQGAVGRLLKEVSAALRSPTLPTSNELDNVRRRIDRGLDLMPDGAAAAAMVSTLNFLEDNIQPLRDNSLKAWVKYIEAYPKATDSVMRQYLRDNSWAIPVLEALSDGWKKDTELSAAFGWSAKECNSKMRDLVADTAHIVANQNTRYSPNVPVLVVTGHWFDDGARYAGGQSYSITDRTEDRKVYTKALENLRAKTAPLPPA